MKGAVSTKATRGRRVEEERKREGRHECARTRRDERAKAPVALSGGGSIPHHHEFARVQRFTNPPSVVCLSASCILTTTSILNQTPLLFSFHPRFWQPPASFHGVGARTNPLFRGVGARDELNYTRSKFNIPFSFPLRQLSHCSVTRRFDHFSCPPILAAG